MRLRTFHVISKSNSPCVEPTYQWYQLPGLVVQSLRQVLVVLNQMCYVNVAEVLFRQHILPYLVPIQVSISSHLIDDWETDRYMKALSTAKDSTKSTSCF